MKGWSVVRGPLQARGHTASTKDGQEAELGTRARYALSRAFAAFSWERARHARRELGAEPPGALSLDTEGQRE